MHAHLFLNATFFTANHNGFKVLYKFKIAYSKSAPADKASQAVNSLVSKAILP